MNESDQLYSCDNNNMIVIIIIYHFIQNNQINAINYNKLYVSYKSKSCR